MSNEKWMKKGAVGVIEVRKSKGQSSISLEREKLVPRRQSRCSWWSLRKILRLLGRAKDGSYQRSVRRLLPEGLQSLLVRVGNAGKLSLLRVPCRCARAGSRADAERGEREVASHAGKLSRALAGKRVDADKPQGRSKFDIPRA